MEPRNQVQHSSKRIQNPFVPGPPVRGDDFFGREDIIDHVFRLLEKKHEIIMLIYGQRRIGKTSLLRKIEKETQQRELACPVYLNLQDQYHKPFSQFLYNMAKAVRYSLDLNLELKEEDFTGSDTSVSHYFQKEFLPRVIEQLPPNRPLLFLLDETDVMIPRRDDQPNSSPNVNADRDFIPFIANWLEDIQNKEYPVKLILAVGREYKDPAQKQFNRLAKYGSQCEIWYFSREETQLLIKNLSDPVIPFDEDAINGIYAITSGHPYYTQCLASHSFNDAKEANKNRVTLDIVKHQVTAAIKSYSAGIYWVWDTLPIDDQAVLYLAAMIKEKNKPINKRNLQKKAAALHMEFTAADLSQALNRLIANKFIKETNHKEKEYNFYIEFFRQWVVNKFLDTGFTLEKKRLEKAKKDMDRVKFEKKKGVLFLADVINFTSQANQLGDTKTAAFVKHLEQKIMALTDGHHGIFIKRIGDGVLIFFEDENQFLEFAVELRNLSKNRGLDKGEFSGDLRMVAHYGKFSFEIIEEKMADLIGPEGIKVFRIGKYAGQYDLIVTGHLYQIIKNALKEKGISVTELGHEKLKGFEYIVILYKLDFSVNKELVDYWLDRQKKEKEPGRLFTKEESLLTFDSKGYHPEDKNFSYYLHYSGKELRGILGSPNFKHNDSIKCVALSPGGKYIVSGSWDNTIKLWEVATGKEIRTFKGHSKWVTGVGLSPDGKHLISASEDKTMKLWEVATGKEIRTIKEHKYPVTSVSFSADGKHLISGSIDSTIRLWDVETGKGIKEFKGHSGGVLSVAISSDNRRIIGSTGSTIRLWDVETGKELQKFMGHGGPANSIAISSDDRQIISGSSDKTLKLWDVETGKETQTFKGHSDWVRSVAIRSDRLRIISGSVDKTIKLWYVESHKEVTFKGHRGIVESVCFSNDEKSIISGSSDNTIKFWDIETGKDIRSFKGHYNLVNSVAFHPHGNAIISGSDDQTIKLWDINAGKEIRSFEGHQSRVNSVAFHPQGNAIISGSDDQTIKLWDINTGKEIRSFKGHEYLVNSVAFHPQGNIIISGSNDDTINLWDIETGRKIITLGGHHSGITSVVISVDGKYLISGSHDKTIKLVYIGTPIYKYYNTYYGHAGSVKSVDLSSDGKQILSGSSDSTIKLWDVESGKDIGNFIGHSHCVNSVCFSCEGKHIISGSDDYTLKLWDIRTGECLKTIDLLWIPREIKEHPRRPGLFATANGNGTISLFDFREILSIQ